MKNILFILVILFTTAGLAQDSTKVKVDTPKIVSKLMYGKTISIEDLEFKFVAIESDSRCPKGVQCIWAGEAVVLLDVFKNGEKIEQKRVVFSPKISLINKIGNVFSSEAFNVSSLNIAPYPKYDNKINAEDYYIQLQIRH
ncbi:hypothetical protein [Lacinutrix sp. Bg11-31]|uniref:hypothetical protein n=1 Tax=Lacinutrix sp. Bg11-31 TaxID=2057808 RepID=UPI000C30B1CE|nr:hypothetical protein [Lacinutrix sp. Bg11-31]AUC82896.1 hypothetical protein CW733_12495 [Lacinutrix sp. Bg11-31]